MINKTYTTINKNNRKSIDKPKQRNKFVSKKKNRNYANN